VHTGHHRILIGITDGFLSDEPTAQAAFTTLPADIMQTWLLLSTTQGLDVSLEDFTKDAREQLQRSLGRHNEYAERKYRERVDEWHALNNAILQHNPMEHWPNTMPTSGADIIAHVMNSILKHVDNTSL
jgi:hypothetical protein